MSEMPETYPLKSRSGDINSYLQKIDDNLYEWIPKTTYRISWFNEDKNDIAFLDPSDGPLFCPGYVVRNKVCKWIHVVDEKYLCYFE
jgi:hypothetical protein